MEKHTYTSADLLVLVHPKSLKSITGTVDDSFLFNIAILKNSKWEDIRENHTYNLE